MTRERGVPQNTVFEYFGTGSMKAVGHATGRVYTFDRPGARVIADARDAPGLALIPNLRLLGSL